MTIPNLMNEIDDNISFQNKWRRIMSGMYFTTTALAVISSGAATVLSGLEISIYTTILAGTATVLFGLEKALLFREKWSHHLSISTQLKALKYRYEHQNIPDSDVSERMATILSEYALNLPISPRQEEKKEEI